MFQFAGWNFFGSIAWMLRDQGVNVVLNLFMGPVANAARGVAMQVSGAVQGYPIISQWLLYLRLLKITQLEPFMKWKF